MNSVIFSVVARILSPVMLIFSLFLALRGHQDAGGGFIGGLVASAALIIYALAQNPAAARRVFPFKVEKLLAMGLALALFSTLIPVTMGNPLMTSVWFDRIGLSGFGTPGLFDFGVYFVVIGMALTILLPLLEDTER